MKINELRDLTNEELQAKFTDLREELFNLRFQKALNRLDNPLRMKVVKKDVARIKTLIKERQLSVSAN